MFLIYAVLIYAHFFSGTQQGRQTRATCVCVRACVCVCVSWTDWQCRCVYRLLCVREGIGSSLDARPATQTRDFRAFLSYFNCRFLIVFSVSFFR